MVNEERRVALDTIVDTYGIEPQVDMAIEECSELIKALLKYRRKQYGSEGFCKDSLRADILDEVVDVSIMLEQLKIIYGFSEKKVEERIEFKLNRQMERILNDESNQPERTY